MKTLSAIIHAILLTIGFALVSMLLIKELQTANASDTIRVGVIDTGIDFSDTRLNGKLCPANEHRDFSGRGFPDTVGHGTHIVGLIEQYARGANYCVVIIKYWNENESDYVNEAHYLKALAYALSINLDILNMSISGGEYVKVERTLILTHPKTLIIGAAGNNHSSAIHYPCGLGYRNIVCVGAVDAKGEIARYSNRGAWVQAWERGAQDSTLPNGKRGVLEGTSMATAVYTGKAIYSLDARRK